MNRYSIILVLGLLTGIICFLIYLSCSESSVKQGSLNAIGSIEKNAEAKRLGAERKNALIAMGYFDRAKTDNPESRSVTKNANNAFDGYYLYGSRHRAQAFLISGSGEVVHTWKATAKKPPWMHAMLLKNGDILAIAKGQYLAKFNWKSKQLWKRTMGAHHDVTIAPDENIYVLGHRIQRYVYKGTQIPIMDDYVVVISPDGKKIRSKNLFPLVRALIPDKRLRRIKRMVKGGASTGKLTKEGAPSDTTHANSIQVIPKEIPKVAPAGSILLSIREINRIVILDNRMEKLLWSWGADELQGQHHATLIENGNITIFDNGVKRKQSRIIEMNPTTGEIVWSYSSKDFYSRLRGSVQKLANGNYLVTESDTGHVFEVTNNSNKIWEFWNPDVIRSNPPTRGVIYRMTAYPADHLADGLLETQSQ